MSDVISIDEINKLTADRVILFQKALEERAFQLGINAYAAGKIYKFINKITGEVIYVGSTKQELKQRKGGHLAFFKKCPDAVWTIYVMGIGGPVNIEMILIELYPCRSKTELMERETYWIRLLNPVCNCQLRATLADDDTADEEDNLPQDYATIRSISEDDAMAIEPTLDDAPLMERLQLKKYWFDNVISQNPTVSETVRADIFDSLSDDGRRQLLLNIWSERHLQTEQSLRFNPYKEEMSTKQHIITQIKGICDKLGLSSSYDQDFHFTEQRIIDCAIELRALVTNLREYFDAYESNAKSPSVALKNDIGFIFSKFSGVSFQTHRQRPRHSGKRINHNSYGVLIDDLYVCNVITLISPIQD